MKVSVLDSDRLFEIKAVANIGESLEKRY